MDYKEKYEAALGWMRKVYPTLTGADKEDAEHFFPELAESEDERIRKFLIDLLSHGTWKKEWPFSPPECVAWLEKQKEQKPAECIADSIKFDEGFKTGREVGFREGVESVKPAEWSEEDDMLMDELESYILYDKEFSEEQKKWRIERLKSFRPQLKQEWGKEDETMLREILRCLDYVSCQGKVEVVKWLKNLPYRFSLSSWGEEIRDAFFGVERNWKPSEEQMNFLLRLEGELRADNHPVAAKTLAEIYEQLKAL